MLPGQGSNGRKLRICGINTAWNTIGDGEFFCPDCGGDRNYRRRTGRRRFAVLGVPLVPRGPAGPVVECAACHGHFGTDILDHPTTVRFSAMLRDAVHTVALAVLAAGGTSSVRSGRPPSARSGRPGSRTVRRSSSRSWWRRWPPTRGGS